MDIEKLVIKAKEGNKKSLELLLLKLKPLVLKEAQKVFIKNYSMEDLIQIGYVSILKSINKYNPAKKRFLGYASAAIKNNYNYLIREKSNMHFEESLYKETFQGLTLMNLLHSSENIQEDYIKKELLTTLYKSIDKLSKEEKEIIIWIYFHEKSLKSYSIFKNKNYGQCRYLKNKALKNLKHHLNKI
ncbi:sigma-70 family RNA polymerase sigma factor [Clostridium rectalis]|uniref:sigma-70 family RNA polymerase sigma factor n=1 Tax=Clostridium rectalis TaxID=2040295 RepID=UPI000F62EE88|nr:sigma-70 family RNA polymerase sigma factor [Clostridium rectalis]